MLFYKILSNGEKTLGDKFILKILNKLGINRCDNQKGILYMIISSLFFACMAVIVKYIRNIPIYEILFFQSLPSIICITVFLKLAKIKILNNNSNIRNLLFRGIFGFSSIAAYYFTLQRIDLSEAVSILQLSPFFVLILSFVFLKERIRFYQISVLFLAFFGALLIIKPGIRVDLIPVIVGILAAFFAATGHVLIRDLRKTDNPITIVYYLVCSLSIISFIVLIYQKNFLMPNKNQLLLLILVGIIYLIGQLLLTKAFLILPASLVSLYKYNQIIFSTFFGVVIFREIPDFYSMIGASLIIFSGFLNYKIGFIKNI